ncbi:hypothetical protein [Olsenella sp. Marseille-P4559]|uniref:hypothetical protein n=1 Tax=Olsenella sp. Marseille-P4559 TaxID=2364795 RepID=UPI00102FF097|nr:hypothetical protein [Olsenella sp. Marseille-P4559]
MSYASNGEKYRRSAHAVHAAGRRAVGGAPRSGAHAAPEDIDDGAAPRQSAAPAGSLETLSAGQGARVTTRDNATEAADIARDRAAERSRNRRLSGRNRPSYGHEPQRKSPDVKSVLLVVAGVVGLFVILAIAAFVTFLNAQDTPQSQETTTTVEEPQQAQTTADGTVTYQGITYSIEATEAGGYAVMGTDSQGNKSQEFTVEGTPVSLILYNSVIVVPENKSNGTWDVVAYTIGGDSAPMSVVDSSGNAITGTGTISSASLDGSVIHVTDSNGTTTDVALE